MANGEIVASEETTIEGPEGGAIATDEEVVLAEESSDLSEPIPEENPFNATQEDIPMLQNKAMGDTITFQISNISDDGVYSLTAIDDGAEGVALEEEVVEEPGMVEDPSATLAGGLV